MLMQDQQVEMCYMGIEDSKNAFKKTMDFIENPSSSSAGLMWQTLGERNYKIIQISRTDNIVSTICTSHSLGGQ